MTVAGLANWQERRKHRVGTAPLVSYAAIQMLAIAVALMAAHLVSLRTGQRLTGRCLR